MAHEAEGPAQDVVAGDGAELSDHGIWGCWLGLQCFCCAALLRQPGVQQPGLSIRAVHCIRQGLHVWGVQGCAVLWEGLPEGTLEAPQAGMQDAAGCRFIAQPMAGLPRPRQWQ